MSWIRQNSFLAAFFAFTAVAAAVLVVLLYMQYDQYSTVSQDYETQARELKRLQTLQPYPSEDNMGKLRAQKQLLNEGISKLEARLAKMALPAEAATPAQFQDRLRASVLSTAELAKENGVKLPEKFYLDFTAYQSLPPKQEATFGLTRQLAGIELVFKQLIGLKVSQIDSLERSILSEEDQKSPQQTPSQAAPPQNGPVQTMTFKVGFKAEQNQARAFINSIAQCDSQFFIIRSVQIRNENPKAPSKFEAVDAKPLPVAPEPGKPAAAEAAPSLKYILGTEKVDVIAQIEIVNFKTHPGK